MNKELKDRRALLKGIAAGSAVVGGAKALPERWSKPLTDSVVIPSHAITSRTVGDTTYSYGDYRKEGYDGGKYIGGDYEAEYEDQYGYDGSDGTTDYGDRGY